MQCVTFKTLLFHLATKSISQDTTAKLPFLWNCLSCVWSGIGVFRLFIDRAVGLKVWRGHGLLFIFTITKNQTHLSGNSLVRLAACDVVLGKELKQIFVFFLNRCVWLRVKIMLACIVWLSRLPLTKLFRQGALRQHLWWANTHWRSRATDFQRAHVLWNFTKTRFLLALGECIRFTLSFLSTAWFCCSFLPFFGTLLRYFLLYLGDWVLLSVFYFSDWLSDITSSWL